jgi:heme-degrading monooxygenase HmoA
MYLRLLQVTLNREKQFELQQMYETRVIPSLQKIEGCLYAALTQNVVDPDEYISMSLWVSKEHVESYERSGVFSELLKEASQYFAGTSEWRIQLSKDMTLEYEPVPQDPVINAYTIPEKRVSGIIPRNQMGQFFVRIASPQIQPDKIEEFKRQYNDHVIPTLRTVKGCLYASLTENAKKNNQLISLTIWNNLHDAEEYERSGLFKALTDRVSHTFSGVYQWKMQIEKESHGHARSSGDVFVEGYKVITSKRFT